MFDFKFTIAWEANGKKKPVETLEQLKSLHDFIGMYLDSQPIGGTIQKSQIPAPNVTPTNHSNRIPPPRTVPIGERAIDYALKAATLVESPFTLKQLAAQMEQLGWKSTAIDKANNVGTTLRNHEAFRHEGEGRWTYLKNNTTPSLLENAQDGINGQLSDE